MIENTTDMTTSTTGQLIVSRELVLLIRWLMENQEEALRKMVKKAVAHNAHMESGDSLATEFGIESLDEMNQHLGDFFIVLESLLEDAITQQVLQTARAKNLMPTIEHLDASSYAPETVRSCLEKTAKKMASDPTSNAKDQLFEELLKQWRPATKHKQDMN